VCWGLEGRSHSWAHSRRGQKGEGERLWVATASQRTGGGIALSIEAAGKRTIKKNAMELPKYGQSESEGGRGGLSKRDTVRFRS